MSGVMDSDPWARSTLIVKQKQKNSVNSISVVIQNVIIEQIIGKYLNNIIDNRSIIYYNPQGNTQVLP